MSKIVVLSEHLANKIAAGEVVERPASVVKELIENAIDANSRRIVISLSDGGTRRIQVSDDGEGMSPEDARLAFQRHATSKLSNEEALYAINTLGFRGEALPSIASVSKVRLVTQRAGDEGTEMFIEGGSVIKTCGIGAPVGSTFEVSELFYNTPARKKFLKSSGTELGHISNLVLQLALSYPEIQFQLTHQNKTVLDVPAVSDPQDRFLQLYGKELLEQCVRVRGALPDNTLVVDGFFSRPPVRKNHRKDQTVFINHRVVKSPVLSHAIYDAYGTFLMKGEHPFFSLSLFVDPTRVDVNVHPTKKEVRFYNTDEIYSFVKRVVRDRLQGGEARAGSRVEEAVVLEGRPEGRMNQQRQRPASSTGSTWVGWPDTKRGTTGNSIKTAGEGEDATGRAIAAGGRTEPISLFSSPHRTPFIRSIGQVYGTFLLAEIDGEFTVIDQHTAHERILYEAFLERGGKPVIQPLLIPKQVDLAPARAALVRERLNILHEVGLKVEGFGENTFLIREVPIALAEIDFEAFLIDLSDDLDEIEVVKQPDLLMHKVMASMACHAAVRANQTLRQDQIETLLNDYFSRNTPATCPHGRPVIVKYPLPELEKLFRRR